MKTFKNQTLLYDDDCPLCRVYTSGFINMGMLDRNGKKPYNQLSEKEQIFIDVNRASNEIALVDSLNNSVIYGIDSLLKVIGFSFPWIEQVGNVRPIKYFLRKLYSFVSYNRKVIIPAKINKNIALQCIPDFSFKYRILFLIFALVTSSVILYLFQSEVSLLEIISLQLSVYLFQSLLFLRFSKQITLNYLGNYSVSILCGGLLLFPIIVLKSIVVVPKIVCDLYFYIILMVVVIDIIRRVQIIKFNLS